MNENELFTSLIYNVLEWKNTVQSQRIVCIKAKIRTVTC